MMEKKITVELQKKVKALSLKGQRKRDEKLN